MNILKSGEQMLRRAILSGRFTSVWTQYGPLSYNRPAPIPYCRNCTVPSFQENSRRTLCSVLSSRDTDSDLSKCGEVKVHFFRELAECQSPSDVLDLVDSRKVSYSHISNCMSRIWKSTRNMSDQQRHAEISLMFNHPSFQKLCHRARVDAPHMNIGGVVHTLMYMVKLGISERSLVVQTLLRVIQEKLNQMDEKSLSVLSCCLRKMESSKNLDALTEGLRLILLERFPETNNVLFLQRVMYFLGKDTSPAVKKQLERKALSMANEFTLPNAQNMLYSLAAMDLNSKPLLDICSKKIAENVHAVPYTRLWEVLKSCCELSYRNLSLFSSISDHLNNTLSMWTKKQIIFILLEFETLCFRPVALLDAFAEQVIQKPDSSSLKDLLSILKIYSSLNHDLKERQQEFLAGVTHALESYLPTMSAVDLLRAVSSLCDLEHFPQALLKKLLQEECLHELLQEEGMFYHSVLKNLNKLDVCLRLDNPPLPPSVLPIPDLHNFLLPLENRANPGLISALQSLFGEAAVKGSVIEEKVHFIDAVITLSEAKDASFPEEHSVTSQKSRRIAVLCAPPFTLCFGTTHPRSRLAMKIRHLKLLGYEPCLIPLHELKTLPDQPMTDILRNKIFPVGGICRIMEERHQSVQRPGQMSTS